MKVFYHDDWDHHIRADLVICPEFCVLFVVFGIIIWVSWWVGGYLLIEEVQVVVEEGGFSVATLAGGGVSTSI